jgi:hypothetical protein
MSDLTNIEKLKLEKFLGMGGGYVLEFSNRTFQEFVLGSLGIDIYEEKYNYASGSKANRLRAFWDKEPNYVIGKLIFDLLEYWQTSRLTHYQEITPAEQALFDECHKIAERLKKDGLVEHIEVIQAYSDDRDFSALAKSIRDSIQRNEPELALDRLHTFVVKYLRQLCDKHEIGYDKNRPLHSLFGEYVKYLRQNKLIESEMAERILKSSITILDSFNDVRNNRSLAHDNPILNYSESVLIFNNVSSTIRFIESIENRQAETVQQNVVEVKWDDITF